MSGGGGDFNNVGSGSGGAYQGGFGGPDQPPANVHVTGHDERGEALQQLQPVQPRALSTNASSDERRWVCIACPESAA